MSKSAFASATKKLILVIALVIPVIFLTHVHANGIVICPEHGVRSAFTGNKRAVFHGSRRIDSCEYTHPLKDLSASHQFWSDCE